MKKLFLLVILFLPFTVFAQEYSGIGGGFQAIADFFSDIFNFFYDDVPTLLQRFYAWALVWYLKAKLYAQFELIKFFWGVAKVIIQDLNIMSQITAQIGFLPQDVKQALVQMRLFDGINLLLTASVTKFVMNMRFA